MIKKFSLNAFAAIVVIAFAGCKTMSTNTVGSKSEWISLFDGKTTNGWHTYGKTNAGNAWKAQDGVLQFDPKGSERGDLVTDQEFGNYHLKLDWKISPNGNSGVIFYVNEDFDKFKQSYNTGLEMQVLDNDGHKDGKIIKHRAGDLYDLISSSTETVKPVGEWNTAEIVSKDGKLDLYLNGSKSVTTMLWDDNWRTMVANSKFKTMPGFGTFKSGKIALQDHGDQVWYRNIMIKKL
ncbi:MAG TPA: DUF1080 domain-containing protein [Sphingobacteriaceae bacterium]|nr:DUF1080 domain-containing protein [Sphingobacteriaceae bacterium]